MSTTGTAAPSPTEVWFVMNSLVRDNQRQSQARISAVIDMPFSRFRALRRIVVQDMTQRDLAERLGVDASAASGIVQDLLALGLVTRQVHPTDGRFKVVTATEEGRAAVATVIEDPAMAPPMFSALDDRQLARLSQLLTALRTESEAYRSSGLPA